MKYKPERDIPAFAREIKSTSPTELSKKILKERNVKRSSQSISWWFSAHPQVLDELNKELVSNSPTVAQVVNDGLFENGSFYEVPSVKNWLSFMNLRRRKSKSLNPEYVRQQIGLLRNFCKRFNKHPDRLEFDDVSNGLMTLEKDPNYQHWAQGKKADGMDTASLRRALKDFLKANERQGWAKIQVGKPSGFQHYNKLALEKTRVYELLDWVKAKNFEIFVVDSIMYRHGLRINAVTEALVENWNDGLLTVCEKFREMKTFSIVPEVAELVKTVIAGRTEGKIFRVDKRDCAKLNGEALRLFAADLIKRFGGHINPNHVWRHFFFQEMLKATEELSGVKNYDLVAEIGQCTAQSLKESYGAITKAEVEKVAGKYLRMLAQEAAKA